MSITKDTKVKECKAWHESIENLRLLAQHLQEKGEFVDIVDYLEKPWKWSPEWHQYIGEKQN